MYVAVTVKMSGSSETICNVENSNDSHSSLGHSSCNMQPKEVLEEFKKLYECRIKRIDEESPNSTELKVTVLEEWVQELYKQNVMLIDAAEELEREARERVALLESRLKCSARAAREATLQLQHFETHVMEASAERVKAQTNSLKAKGDLFMSEQEQSQLRKEVAGLRNDVAGLLHLIKRALRTGEWNTTGLIFFEVSLDELQSIIKEKTQEIQPGGISNSRSEDFCKIARVLEQEVIDKDSIIARLESEMTHLSQELAVSESAHQIGRLGITISETNETISQLQQQLQNCDEENDKQSAFIEQLKEEIAEKRSLVAKLRSNLTQMEKESREARDVLTNEVAEKHDQVLLLRGEVEKLEEALHKACMQTRFKDDIIKEMRQEIRTARAKVGALEYHIQCHNEECHGANPSLYPAGNKANCHFPTEKLDLSTSTHRIPSSEKMHRHVDPSEKPSSSLLPSSCSGAK